ncbi:tail protein [Mycobacterium phage Indlulamithi]|uniref:Metalloprotease n=1 Tax=Mycobacterium phage Indlulamithi TaxID=2656582 RepID=A0A649VCJ5_9CAUD|nr:tail protein [Mycobacterium phage Indlulamithi]QGJ90047.1 metalloprotease [Mycobacterium phage Indlulamithi]
MAATDFMNDDTREWLMRRAIQAQPFEVCGFILKDGSVVEIPNASHDPERGFVMTRQHLCDRIPDPSEIQAIWHTHPKGSDRPSKGDIDSMFHGAIDRNWDYLIVTGHLITKIDPKSFVKQDNSFWEAFAS